MNGYVERQRCAPLKQEWGHSLDAETKAEIEKIATDYCKAVELVAAQAFSHGTNALREGRLPEFRDKDLQAQLHNRVITLLQERGFHVERNVCTVYQTPGRYSAEPPVLYSEIELARGVPDQRVLAKKAEKVIRRLLLNLDRSIQAARTKQQDRASNTGWTEYARWRLAEKAIGAQTRFYLDQTPLLNAIKLGVTAGLESRFGGDASTIYRVHSELDRRQAQICIVATVRYLPEGMSQETLRSMRSEDWKGLDHVKVTGQHCPQVGSNFDL